MYTQACTTASARPSLLRRLLDWLATRETETRARQRLARLEPHLLRDIGMTAEEAAALSQTPEWDAPAHWRR
ncbi:hypothetical protein [Gemmobacter sp.]|uniref:hypothetical protein n=1 Tax=Gemmobacter sp. TaxID=1898957 RepID=UPI0025C6D5C6|nr:hypothetical protein [Gemmobacter sp.]